MRNIAIIGAGQLGSRHLQALSKIRFSVAIEVVDPFASALETARARFKEMPANSNIGGINFYSSISKLSKKIDLAIIATNADVRADVIRMLVKNCDVKNLFLEKVLFQKPEEYEKIELLLKEKGINTWVNHPRRVYPYYKKLKEMLAGSTQVSYQVHGGGWGLGCNGLHMIDNLAFLTGGEVLVVDAGRLNSWVSQSKRKGFLEVSGTLTGRVGSHPFTLFCHDIASPVVISICSDNLNVIIDEGNGWVRIARKESDWQWVQVEEKIICFQSELSNKIAEDIIEMQQCDLPTFSEAANLHLPFIKALLEHINRNSGVKYSACPIT